MAFKKDTVWANVTLDTLKSTKFWINNFKSDHGLSNNQFISSCLVELGYDHEKLPYKESMVNIRSQHDKKQVYATLMYSYPVKEGHHLSKQLDEIDILHFNQAEESETKPLETFGLDYHTTLAQ